MTEFTADQIALEAHIVAENAAFNEQCKANGATWWTNTVSDPTHWAEYDITTIAGYERHCVISSIWDGYKELNGFRPRFMNLDEMSMDELRKMEASIYDEMDADGSREAQRVEADIEAMMEHGAPDRETAQRWIEEAA
jgi:hypothetical protein